MAKTITIDSIQSVRLQLVLDPRGNAQVSAEYTLNAGAQPIRLVHQDVTARLSAARRSSAKTLVDGITQDIAGFELT